MRVPFPYALSIGTDIIAHGRLLQSNKTSRPINLSRLVNRILHPSEIVTLNKRFPNWRSLQLHQEPHLKFTTWLAGRWAAKEAAKKAWGAHLISFRDLRIEQANLGEVQVVCQSFEEHDSEMHGESPEQVAKLSISHDGDYAVATVIAAPLHSDIVAALEARKVSIRQEAPVPINEDANSSRDYGA